MRPVVITGLGVVSAVGSSVGAFADALRTGRSGTALVRSLDPDAFAARIGAEAGEVSFDHLVSAADARNLDRQVLLALHAADQAVRQAGLGHADDPFRRGVILGTGMGPAASIEDTVKTVFVDSKKPRPTSIPKMMDNAATGHLSMHFGCRGPSQMIVTACAASAHALAQATMLIRAGVCDACLAGGSEAFPSHALFASWDSLRVMSRRNQEPEAACRPFSADRDGFVIGEGAAIMVLESADSAKARGAEILAEIAGCGLSSDAHHITAPRSDGQQAAVAAALADARVTPEQVGYINAHGTATPVNDPVETETILAAYGAAAPRIPVSSTKSGLGHTIGAAGALEAAACLLALRDGFLPPTLHLEEVDPACAGLRHIPREAIDASIDVAVSHSFAFGGHNVVLVLRHFHG